MRKWVNVGALRLWHKHVQNKIHKLNGITLENRIIFIEDVTSTRKSDT